MTAQNKAQWSHDIAREIIERERKRPGALLPVLHALMAHFGHIDAAAVALVAQALNLSRAEVHGVITFYADFSFQPDTRRRIRLCRAEACRSLGVEALVHHAATQHGVTPAGEGSVKLESTYCLGLCANGPAAMLDEDGVIGRLDAAKLSALIEGATLDEIVAGENVAGENAA